MVLGVCRRVLGNSADADDACQATFLVLARKANLARWRPSVASWLYATARQVALTARTARLRRVRHEGRAARKAPPNPLAQITGEELLSILDEELARLPERYRSPVVLCCLEGLTRDEAARQLGVPPATLKGQLERGRRRLHTAHERRGAPRRRIRVPQPPGGRRRWKVIATAAGDASEIASANGFLKKGPLGACCRGRYRVRSRTADFDQRGQQATAARQCRKMPGRKPETGAESRPSPAR